MASQIQPGGRFWAELVFGSQPPPLDAGQAVCPSPLFRGSRVESPGWMCPVWTPDTQTPWGSGGFIKALISGLIVLMGVWAPALGETFCLPPPNPAWLSDPLLHSVPCVFMSSAQSHPLRDPTSLLWLRDFPGQSAGVGCHCLHQGIFLIQGSIPRLLHLLHWQTGSLALMPPGEAEPHLGPPVSPTSTSPAGSTLLTTLHRARSPFLANSTSCLKQPRPPGPSVPRPPPPAPPARLLAPAALSTLPPAPSPPSALSSSVLRPVLGAQVTPREEHTGSRPLCGA